MSAMRVARAATKRDKHRQVRRLLSRPRGLVPRAGGIRRDDARRADEPGRAGGGRGRHAARALQRPRVGRSGRRARHREQIAAVIVEPIAGNIGRRPAARGLPRGPARDLRLATASLLIFDEVISGFRAAAGGAQQLFGVRPDLTCLGKIIGGGLPVGAYGGRADLMELVAPAGPVYQAGTLSGNPLAMTAGLWSLTELSPQLYRHLAQLGAQLAAGLAGRGARRRRADAGQRVRIAGDAVLHERHRCATSQSAMKADAAMYGRFFSGMLARGVYPPPSQFEAWFLSGAHTERDVEKTVKAARAALEM